MLKNLLFGKTCFINSKKPLIIAVNDDWSRIFPSLAVEKTTIICHTYFPPCMYTCIEGEQPHSVSGAPTTDSFNLSCVNHQQLGGTINSTLTINILYSVTTYLPLRPSHSLIDLSNEADAMILLSGEKATQLISCWWPVILAATNIHSAVNKL